MALADNKRGTWGTRMDYHLHGIDMAVEVARRHGVNAGRAWLTAHRELPEHAESACPMKDGPAR
ncbi:MAG: hypothetical protein WC273_05705 [Dehalococcoidia bacterium]